MNTEKPNNEYKITYNYTLEFEGVLLAFRKKELFDISKLPIHIPFNKTASAWLINRKQLTLSKAQELTTNKQVTVDVTDMQWYQQEQLNHVFNL
jgi:hypothetical protein